MSASLTARLPSRSAIPPGSDPRWSANAGTIATASACRRSSRSATRAPRGGLGRADRDDRRSTRSRQRVRRRPADSARSPRRADVPGRPASPGRIARSIRSNSPSGLRARHGLGGGDRSGFEGQLYRIGFAHPGQTEFVAERCGVSPANVLIKWDARRTDSLLRHRDHRGRSGMHGLGGPPRFDCSNVAHQLNHAVQKKLLRQPAIQKKRVDMPPFWEPPYWAVFI